MSASSPVMPSTKSTSPEDRHTLALANSDRIQLLFGNYGIQVLENSPGMRISSLYSIHDGIKTNRTFAVVAYPEVVAEAIKKEHQTIIGGESIGIVFRNNGWHTIKHHQYFGELEASTGDSDTRSVFGATRPAIHIYWLSVMKNNSEFRYARIAEVHHPDYLQLEDLKAIYRDDFNDNLVISGEVSEMLEIVKSKMQMHRSSE
jgi:hypothetical protein